MTKYSETHPEKKDKFIADLHAIFTQELAQVITRGGKSRRKRRKSKSRRRKSRR